MIRRLLQRTAIHKKVLVGGAGAGQRRVQGEKPHTIIAHDDRALRWERLRRQFSKLFVGRTLTVPDHFKILHQQSDRHRDGRAPDQRRDSISGDPAQERAAPERAGGGGVEYQQEIAGKIADAQHAKVNQRQTGMPAPKRSRTERRIECHINTGQQKYRMDNVGHQVGQCGPGRADVPKRGRPFNADEQDWKYRDKREKK